MRLFAEIRDADDRPLLGSDGGRFFPGIKTVKGALRSLGRTVNMPVRAVRYRLFNVGENFYNEKSWKLLSSGTLASLQAHYGAGLVYRPGLVFAAALLGFFVPFALAPTLARCGRSTLLGVTLSLPSRHFLSPS
jgi:hypothetical protein